MINERYCKRTLATLVQEHPSMAMEPDEYDGIDYEA